MLHQHHPLGIDFLRAMKATQQKNGKAGDWLVFVCYILHACLLETKVQNNGAVLEKDNGSDR